MSSIRQLHSRAARIGARRRMPKNDTDSGEWYALLSAFADQHFGGDIQACASAMDERIKAHHMSEEIAAILEAMRAHCKDGISPEELVAGLARVMRDMIAPGSLADVAPQPLASVSSP